MGKYSMAKTQEILVKVAVKKQNCANGNQTKLRG
jgi:hypothetical protein